MPSFIPLPTVELNYIEPLPLLIDFIIRASIAIPCQSVTSLSKGLAQKGLVCNLTRQGEREEKGSCRMTIRSRMHAQQAFSRSTTEFDVETQE